MACFIPHKIMDDEFWWKPSIYAAALDTATTVSGNTPGPSDSPRPTCFCETL